MLSLWIQTVLESYISFAFVFALFIVAEILLARSTMTIRERFASSKFWAIMLPLDIVVIVLTARLSDALGIVPIFTFESTFGSPIAAAIFAALLGDFQFYWFHRFQHRFLWRFHSVHHSIENMSAANSYHHWTEAFWGRAFFFVPLAFFQIVALEQAVWVALLMRIYPFYIHSPIWLHMGPLSSVIVDNRFHRIHHSVEEHHFDRNFGAITTIWDRMFGTAYFPAKDEWPDVGIAAHGEPRTIRQWIAAGDRSGSIKIPAKQPSAARPVSSSG